MQHLEQKGFTTQGVFQAGDGTDLHWYSRQEQQARYQIIGIHGLGEHAGRYARFADQIAADGGKCSFLDLRGHGKSGGKRGHSPSWQLLIEDVQLFLKNQLDPDLPVFFFGHSMGGGLALSYALQLSQLNVEQRIFCGFIAASPLLKLSFTPPGWKLFLARLLVGVWPAFSLDRGINSSNLTRDKDIQAEYLADPLNHERVSAALTLDFLEAGQKSLALAGELKIPTLILHGQADRVTDPEASRIFASIASGYAEFESFPHCRHELLNELNRDQVVQSIFNWIHRQIALQPGR